MKTQSKLFKATARIYGWLHDRAPYPLNRLRALLDGWMARREQEQESICSPGLGDAAPLLILQFKADATEPTATQSAQLHKWLIAAFPGRRVVLLPCGIEVSPGSQEELMRISGKLDHLIEVLADEEVDEVRSVVSVSLSGEPLGCDRDQTQGLG